MPGGIGIGWGGGGGHGWQWWWFGYTTYPNFLSFKLLLFSVSSIALIPLVAYLVVFTIYAEEIRQDILSMCHPDTFQGPWLSSLGRKSPFSHTLFP